MASHLPRRASCQDLLVSFLAHVDPDVVACHDRVWAYHCVAKVLVERLEASLDLEPEDRRRAIS
jgi:hypothetical protein